MAATIRCDVAIVARGSPAPCSRSRSVVATPTSTSA